MRVLDENQSGGSWVPEGLHHLQQNDQAEMAANDDLAGRYFQIWDTYPIQQYTDRLEQSWLEELVPKGARVMVAGSGAGRELPSLLNLGCQITAVDLSPKMLEAGKQRYPNANIEWIQANLHDLPASLRDFEYVVALGAVTNYLKDLDRALANLERALTPGGKILLASFNSLHPTEKDAKVELKNSRVRFTYSPEELETHLKQAGLHILEFRGFRYFLDFLPPEWNKSFRKTAPYAIGFQSLINSELQLNGLLSPDLSKMFWAIAEKPKMESPKSVAHEISRSKKVTSPQCLVVLPNREELRQLRQKTGNPYFSHGIQSYLEMYGLIGYETCFQEDLSSRLKQDPPVLVFLCRSENHSLIIENLDALKKLPDSVEMEGPISEPLAHKLEIQHQKLTSGQLSQSWVVNADLRRQLTSLLDGYNCGWKISLEPTVLYTADNNALVPVASPIHSSMERGNTFRPNPQDILAIVGNEYTQTLLTQRGNFLISSFPVFDLIARRLAAAPTPHPVKFMDGERQGENLDYLLLLAMAQVCRQSGRPMITVEPWPNGMRSVTTVRHDFDRPVSPEDWNRLITWERSNQVAASWYFLATTANPAQMADIVSLGHEIGFHYRNLQKHGTADLQAIRKAADKVSAAIVGASCHGGNFFGQEDLVWHEQAGLTYTEILSRNALFPFRPLVVEDNQARPGKLIASARHISVDATVSPPTSDFIYGLQTRDCRYRTQGHNVIMNHPDINFADLVDAVKHYRLPGSESWTQAQVIDWWQKTHIQPQALLSRQSAGNKEE